MAAGLAVAAATPPQGGEEVRERHTLVEVSLLAPEAKAHVQIPKHL